MGDSRMTGASAGLVIDDLSIGFAGGRREAISSLSLAVSAGESVGLVGESGSGKSLTARAVLGILPPGVAVKGRILFDGASVLDLSPQEMRKLRGSGVAMIFQDPMSSLNPVLSVGDAIVQVILSHSGVSRGEARSRAVELMQRVGIRDAASRASSYPHEFSGGMRQRIMIAMVLAARPRLLLADEPTTALDVIVQAGCCSSRTTLPSSLPCAIASRSCMRVRSSRRGRRPRCCRNPTCPIRWGCWPARDA